MVAGANAAEPRDSAKNGGAVGASWDQGRWPGKDALHFKGPGDRVRLRLEGTFDSLTLGGATLITRGDHDFDAAAAPI